MSAESFSFSDRAARLIAEREARLKEQGRHEELSEWRKKINDAKEEAQASRTLMNLLSLYMLVVVIAWYSSNWKQMTKITVPIRNPDLEFDRLGLPSSRLFPLADKGRSLELIGAGVRKKFNVISVYSIGMYIDENKKKELLSKGALSVLSSPLQSSGGGPSLGLLLKFQREVSKDKVVNAIVEQLSLKGRKGYKEALDTFQDFLLKQMGPSMRKNDLIEFTYQGKAQVCVSVNNKSVECLENNDLRTRLLTVYGGEESVAPELRRILELRFLR